MSYYLKATPLERRSKSRTIWACQYGGCKFHEIHEVGLKLSASHGKQVDHVLWCVCFRGPVFFI